MPPPASPAPPAPTPPGQPVRFDRYMDDALYGAAGFYTQGGRPGMHHGDFGTSPERGALLGRCIARYLDETWHQLEQPERFVVIEAGAGVGTLCKAVIEAKPECLESLHYLMVERSPINRSDALNRLSDLSAEANVPIDVAQDLPTRLSWYEMPGFEPDVAPRRLGMVVMANELLDNIAVRIVERTQDGWQELYVTPADPAADSASADPDSPTHLALAESFQPAPPLVAQMADRLLPDAPVGMRIPLQVQAAVWVRRALQVIATKSTTTDEWDSAKLAEESAALAEEQAKLTDSADSGDSTATNTGPVATSAGRLLLIDYGCTTTTELSQRTMTGWLRTYSQHRRNIARTTGEPHTNHDITCDVAFDQLPAGYRLTVQTDWLIENGLREFTDDARHSWQFQRTAPADEVLRSRALLDEAGDLTNPAGLGSFWVAEWHVSTEPAVPPAPPPAPTQPPPTQPPTPTQPQ